MVIDKGNCCKHSQPALAVKSVPPWVLPRQLERDRDHRRVHLHVSAWGREATASPKPLSKGLSDIWVEPGSCTPGLEQEESREG